MMPALLDLLLGRPFALPDALLAQFPELARARFRRGGLALRIGGWCLGRSTVSGITLWRSISLAQSAQLDPMLLLHELRHVDQFQGDRAFPVRYVWGSLRHGYWNNPYEADARAFAERRCRGATPTV